MQEKEATGAPAAQQKNKIENVSPAVIKRLPRYFRYLRELIREGKLRISSSELSARMRVTASQIRQDLNCFGGFGQQGYGYNVQYLYTKISELLGVGDGFSAIIIGMGNLGRALANNPMFEKRGVDVLAAFDIGEQIVGKTVGSLTVRHMNELPDFCRRHRVDIAVLTLPKEATPDVVCELSRLGVKGLWNFTGIEPETICPEMVVENVHMGDSLMTLCYQLHTEEEKK
jgi:redox-sensing transcriptional repressor